MDLSNIYELGLSDHYAQVLTMTYKNSRNTTTKIWKRRFNEYNISKFSDLLKDLSWNEVYQKTEVNAKFEVFMNVISVLFDKAFPPKLKNISKPPKATWVTQGIRISSKNVRFFNMVKNLLLLSKDARLYITKYNKTYRKIIKEAKKRENDRFLLQATNKHKAMWQVINKELGKSTTKKQDITINIGSTEIVDPEVITELFNAHFCEAPDELLNKCKFDDTKIFDYPYFYLNTSTKSLFLTPVTESEVVKVTKDLKINWRLGLMIYLT